MDIVLYEKDGCPKCKILKAKLDKTNIEYKKVEDIDLMIKMGMFSAPMLQVDGTLYNFGEADKWINGMENII